MRHRLAAALAISLAGCSTVTSQRLDSLFSDLHRRGLFDGAVVAGHGANIVWERGYGYANAEQRVPFTPATPADGGSLAKTFTAAVVVQLASEGTLDLDEPVRRILPELPYADVTLRHLLSHSSGIPVLDYDYFDRYLSPAVIRTTEALLGVIAEEKPALAFTPGTAFEYSSFGFDLAALAAARASGKAFAQLLDERIFAPLGITSAFLRPARFADFPGVRTLGYRRVNGALQRHEVFDNEAFHGGSNVYISARDLHRWNASFLNRSLLAAPVAADLHEPARIGDAPSGLTLGSWYRDAERSAFWYSGHLQGFHDEVFRDLRSNRSIVYVSNNTLEPWLQKAIVRAVRAILRGETPSPLQPPATADVSKSDREHLAGDWILPRWGTLTIEVRPDRVAMARDGASYRMVQVSPSTFYVPGLDFMVGFARNANAAFARIHVADNIAEEWGVRAVHER